MVHPSPVQSGFRAALPAVVGEFLRAFIDRTTYRPRENPYIVFGFLWGLPVPFVTIGVEVWARSMTWAQVPRCLLEHPIQLIFLAHPLLFALVFGAMGTVRRRKDIEIQDLLRALERKVQELEQAYDRLKDLDRMKSEFIANVSHELRTPMVCISGYTEQMLANRMGPLTQKQEEGLKVMERNADRLLSLIDELLEAARFENGKVNLARIEFDLREVAQQAVASLDVIATQRGVAVACEAPEAPLRVTADRERIYRVFLNLIANAIKFTERGGKAGVRLEALPNGDAEVTVWDSGIGIAPENLAKIFDRFWQADGSSKRRYGGTGLGLAIVKSVLDAHGAAIRVTSEPGKGSRFTFHLPHAGTGRGGAHAA